MYIPDIGVLKNLSTLHQKITANSWITYLQMYGYIIHMYDRTTLTKRTKYCAFFSSNEWMRSSLLRMRSRLVRMRSSLVVRASDWQCTSCNGPGFDPSIRRHSGIWGAADEAVLNIIRTKRKKSPKKIFKKKNEWKTPAVRENCADRSSTYNESKRQLTYYATLQKCMFYAYQAFFYLFSFI
jgi:hypothetical protein